MPGGYLVVLSEPGQVPLDEFNDWYDKEHVPLRLNHIPAFQTGARFKALDGAKPSWLALYDVDSPSTFNDPSYISLRENRSPREEAIIKRLDVVDRRICEAMDPISTEHISNAEDNTKGNTGLAMGNPTQWIFTHWMDFKETERPAVEGVNGWTSDLIKVWKALTDACRKHGSIRSRLFRCTESQKTGVSVSPDSQEQSTPTYFIVHEVVTRDSLDSIEKELQAPKADSLLTRMEITERRLWELHRAFPGLSQGNLP